MTRITYEYESYGEQKANKRREEKFLVLRPPVKHTCDLPMRGGYPIGTMLRCNTCQKWWYSTKIGKQEKWWVVEFGMWRKRRRITKRLAQHQAKLAAQKAAKDYPKNSETVESFDLKAVS